MEKKVAISAQHITQVTPVWALTTATGGVRFEPIRMLVYPTAFVLGRMQKLHDRAIGAADKKKLSPKRAKVAFRLALEASLGSYVAQPDSVRLELAGTIFDAVTKLRSIDGLESLFLTAMVTASSLGSKTLAARGEKLWKAHAPAKIGGGRKAALVFDATNHRVAFIGKKGLESLGSGGAHANVVGGANMYEALAGQVSALDAGIAQDGDGPCVTVFSIVGSQVGEKLGKTKGGTAGGIAGGIVGDLVGKAVGGVICGWFDTGTSTGGYSGQGGADPGTSQYQDGATEESDSGDNSSQGDEKNTCEPDDPENGDNSSSASGSSDNSSGSGDSGGSDDNSGNDKDGGMPDPDDPKGFPSPDDPHGSQAFSTSYAMGPGVASHMSTVAGGGVLLTGMPQLGANGAVATAGFLSALSNVAATVSQAAQASLGTVASTVVSTVAKGATQAIAGEP